MALKILSGPLTLGKGGGLQIGGFNARLASGTLQAWFKADAGTNTTTDGVAVTSWTDYSGNGRNAAQATGSLQPIYKANVQNGKPGILFDGVDDALTIASTALVSSLVGGPYTIFACVKQADLTGTVRCFWGGGGSGPIDQVPIVGFSTSTKLLLSQWSDDATFAQSFTTSPMIYCVQKVTPAASGSLGWANGTALAAATPGTNDPATKPGVFLAASTRNSAIGASTGLATPINGHIFELLIYSGQLSTADRKTIQTYLGQKYGITVS